MSQGGSNGTINTGNPLQANPVSSNPVMMSNPVSGSPALNTALPNVGYGAPPGLTQSLMNQLKASATGQGMPGAPPQAGGGTGAPGAAGQDANAAMMAAQQGVPYAPSGGAAAAAAGQAKIAALLKMLG